MSLSIPKAYWKAKNKTQVAQILQIARKYDHAIAIAKYQSQQGLLSTEEAQKTIEAICHLAEQEMSRV